MVLGMVRPHIKKVIDRAISVSRDELETTYIIQGRPLSDVIDILGVLKPRVVNISEKGNELGVYVPPRPMHEVPPLAHLAQPLAFEVWVHFYDINGIPVYYISEPPIDEVGIKFYVFLRQRVGELGATKPSEIVSLAKDSLDELGVDSRIALNDESIKASIYYVFRDMLGYGALEVPMEDVYVEEVSWFAYDGPVEVVDKKISDVYPNSEFIPTNLFFEPSLPDLQKKFFMTQVVRSVTAKARVGLTTAKPLAEARIPDPTGRGFHRLAAHLDITSRSPAVTIRKFPHKKLSITELIKFGTLSPLEASYLIWQLINRGFILIVGGMASGKSVTPLSHLLIRKGNSIRLVTFDELWRELSLDTKPIEMGEMEVINNPNIEVLTITNEKVEWKKPKYIIRHKHKGKIYRIRTKTGRTIEVTADHSLLVWKVGDRKDKFSIKLTTMKPSELKEKDLYLPFLRRLNVNEQKEKYNTFLKNPEIGYLIGFLVAEASHGGYVFEQAKGEVLDRIIKILTNNNIPFTIGRYNKRKQHIMRVYFRNPFRKLILNLKLGNNSREKRVPDIFWNTDEEWRSAFLAGVIDGDGSINPGKYIIEIATASRELAYGLLYGFASVGIHAYIRERRIKKYPDRIYYRVFVPIGINKVGLSKITRYLSEEKRKLIEEAMENSRNHHSETDIIPAEIAYAIGSMLKRKEHGGDEKLSFEIRSYKYKRENPSFYRVESLVGEKLYEFIPYGVGFDKVEEIEEIEYDGYVYDIEVPETQNFEANGIFVHNTTLLQALISALPVSYKVVTVEDTPELSTPAQNWHPLYVRRAPRESELEDVTFSRLVIHSLRHRGTIVTLGEVRGAEMADLIQAAASVSRDTPVLVRVNGVEKLVGIGELVDGLYNGKPDWSIVVPGDRIEVLTLTRDGRVEFRPVKWVLRHYHKGILYRVWYEVNGKEDYVDMTYEHSVFVKRDGRNIPVRGKDLKVGDTLIVLGDWDSRKYLETPISRIETVEYDDYVYDLSVPDTEAFFGGRIPILLHNSGHGAICLPPETPILARRKGEKERIVTIEEVVDGYDNGEEWEVYSFDSRKRRFEWKPVTASIRMQTDLWVKIKTESGRELKMTPDHRVPVYNPITDTIDILLAKDLRIGDLIPITGKLARNGVIHQVRCCKMFISLSADTGRILGMGLLHWRNKRRQTIPIKYKELIEKLPFKTKIQIKNNKIKIYSTKITELIQELIETVRQHPFSLPPYFLDGLAEIIENKEVAVGDRETLYSLHYALKTAGYDSVVNEEGGTIKVTGKKEEEVFFEKIVEVKTEQALYDEAYDIEVEGSHTFVTKDSIVTGNCTFHAHDPESVLARITSPPINAAPESLKLITSIVHVAKTKTYARGKAESVRRILRIFEIKDVKGKEIYSSETFKWSPLTDKHFPPLTDKGLIELWRRSPTVQVIGKNLYVDEAPRALVELLVLSRYLEYLTKNKVFDIKEVVFRMTTLYLRMDNMVNKLWNEKYKAIFKNLM